MTDDLDRVEAALVADFSPKKSIATSSSKGISLPPKHIETLALLFTSTKPSFYPTLLPPFQKLLVASTKITGIMASQCPLFVTKLMDRIYGKGVENSTKKSMEKIEGYVGKPVQDSVVVRLTLLKMAMSLVLSMKTVDSTVAAKWIRDMKVLEAVKSSVTEENEVVMVREMASKVAEEATQLLLANANVITR